MLMIPGPPGLSRAGSGPGAAGVFSPSSAPALAGAGGPEYYSGAAIGVFSQSEVMAAACTLPTAAVKTASQPAAR